MTKSTLHELESRLRLPGLAERLGKALLECAEPVLAPSLAGDVIEAAAGERLERLAQAWTCRQREVVLSLSALCGAAPFLVPFLTRYPDWLCMLVDDDLAAERTAAKYQARLTAALAGVPEQEHAAALRRFKYYELARITIRELSEDLVPLEKSHQTLAELSHLADALLARALITAAERLTESCGPPRWKGPEGDKIDLSFCALGLGKLGSEELNYSSDVDLIYIFGGALPAPSTDLTGGPHGLSPFEYFTRLGQEFGRLVTETTSEGFLYRIDLDLRPEGSRAALVVSSDMLADYYELWAATWEKAAFMKARPIAGDLALGWRTIRAINPMIYRSSMDLAGVAAIRSMKDRIEQEKGRTAATFDVKIGTGGIRDVEFIAQALQLLHGGRIPQVRERSTRRALVSLAQVGVLPEPEANDLLAAYRFLRRTEDRIQMEAERQVHRLPSHPDGMMRLARAMGFLEDDPPLAFDRALETHRQRIRQVFTELFREARSDQVLALFTHSLPSSLAGPRGGPLIEHLAGHFVRALEASPDPERAMNNLDRFIRGVGRQRFYYELLLDRPELVPRLTAMFGASEYFSTYFATHPGLIEPIFSDPNVLLLSPAELREDHAKIRDQLALEARRDPAELALDALRLFHNRALLNVGLLDLGDKVTASEADKSLTDIAELCVQEALAIAQAEMQRRSGGIPESALAGEFLVVGMGKLASREITYGSDLDLIFLYDIPSADDSALAHAQEYFVRLAQKLIWALRTRTPEGVCYEIDARLRPSGQQGTLVTSLAALRRYHASSAQVWERQALLRARPVAGGDRLASSFETLRLKILSRPCPEGMGDEIHRIRLRMETELGQESKQRHDFKTGRGGLQDVESVVQFLQLKHGGSHPQLLVVDTIGSYLNELEHQGLLHPDDARTLRDGWEFLQRLSRRLRILQNRSISDLDEERGDLDALARQLGYTSQRADAARRPLLDDYRRHTSAIREVYLKVLGVG